MAIPWKDSFSWYKQGAESATAELALPPMVAI